MEHPKVRFSQCCEFVTEEKDDKVKEINNIACSKGRVKIKSIVPTNFPIKVLDNGQRIIVNDKIHKFDVKELSCSKNENSIKITKESAPIKQIQSKSIINNNRSEIPLSAMESIIHEIQNVNLGEFPQSNLSSDKLAKTIPIATDQNEQDHSDVEFIREIDNSANLSKKKNYTKRQISSNKTKINFDCLNKNKCDKWNMNKGTKKENKENCSKSSSVKFETNKLLESNTILQDSNKLSAGSIAKNLCKSQKPMELMPCAKFKLNKSSIRNKKDTKKSSVQIKKSTVFDIMGNPSKVSIEAGTLHKINDPDFEIINNDKKIASTDLLCRPEYNSMIGVMKNLKDIEKEKLVKDYEHLPKIYQNFVSEKMSAALDFAPYETVYKDLIDLSIDDDKLPTRIFRTKDPEPRDKDIVPKLSDFYNPKYTDQHFTIANIKPLNPTNLNTLNAFTISNKICTWKVCRDNF